MRIEIPEGKDPITYVWGELVPGIGVAASHFAMAVYEHSTLALDEFEAARLRIAQINGCLFCLAWRTERDGRRVDDDFAQSVLEWRTTARLGVRARLAAEFAELYATDHHAIDDSFWDRMLTVFDQREAVELSMCIGSWMGFGRLNRIFGLDEACVLPSHPRG
ncbi:MAG: carboxymuconolactone decarboxylase family protein [Marmoricola sp.]